jgi:transcriptional regulator CtsR
MAAKNQTFLKDLVSKAEKDKRETQRQNIITAFNMAASSFS